MFPICRIVIFLCKGNKEGDLYRRLISRNRENDYNTMSQNDWGWIESFLSRLHAWHGASIGARSHEPEITT